MDASDRSVNMQKWGIPEEEMVSAEITLLERLVWVPYKDHWWPALLYENYTELQAHLYDELDMVLKAQFAVAIMRQMNNPKEIKVARLLGREILEVVEVDDEQHAEFYWKLPKVLPMACKKSRYGNDTKLYLDFHRALDQVEEIIRDISESSFNLIPSGEKRTWVQRAEEALNAPNVSKPIVKPRQETLARSSKIKSNSIDKAAIDKEEYNFLFSALDNVMEQLNNTYDCVSGETSKKIVEEPVAAVVQQAPVATINIQSSAMSKQKETRDTLRIVLAKQRQIRQSGCVGSSTNCIAADEARNPSSDGNGELRLRRSPSTEVLPGLHADDIVPGITGTGMWNLLSSKDEDENPTNLPLGPYESSQSQHEIEQAQSYSAQKHYVSTSPELTRVSPQKAKSTVARTSRGRTYMSPQNATEAREEKQTDDREAFKAAARAAAAVELDISFWDTMTCHTMEN